MLDTSFTGASSSRPASRPSSSRAGGQNPLCLLQKQRPAGRQAHAARHPVEERRARLPLQLRHGVGNRRLGEEQLLRRPGKGARPRDRLQNFQMPQVHHVPPDMNLINVIHTIISFYRSVFQSYNHRVWKGSANLEKTKKPYLWLLGVNLFISTFTFGRAAMWWSP